jgi:hypothetical protein
MTRLIAAAVALFIVGAPVVTTACEALCAARADVGTMSEHHSCHHQVSPANKIAITSTPHVCGHSDDGPSAVAQSVSPLAVPAVIEVAFTFAPPSIEVARGDVVSRHDPPLISPRSGQLRI